jgi:hypothetical protein
VIGGERFPLHAIVRVDRVALRHRRRSQHPPSEQSPRDERCRRVRTLFDGRIPEAWPAEERLSVALVLFDRAHLEAMDYTPQQATRSVADRMLTPPTDLEAWLERIRDELVAEGLPVYPAPPTDAELADMR